MLPILLFQGVSPVQVFPLRVRVVPPTEITLGEAEGYPAGLPESPADARKVTLVWPEGVVNRELLEGSDEDSLPPQLIVTTETPA